MSAANNGSCAIMNPEMGMELMKDMSLLDFVVQRVRQTDVGGGKPPDNT